MSLVLPISHRPRVMKSASFIFSMTWFFAIFAARRHQPTPVCVKDGVRGLIPTAVRRCVPLGGKSYGMWCFVLAAGFAAQEIEDANLKGRDDIYMVYWSTVSTVPPPRRVVSIGL